MQIKSEILFSLMNSVITTGTFHGVMVGTYFRAGVPLSVLSHKARLAEAWCDWGSGCRAQAGSAAPGSGDVPLPW